MGLDGQRMDAGRHQQAQSIIHEAMSRHAGQAAETSACNPHAEVSAFACAGMAGMACARALTRLGHRPCLVAPEHDAANRGETLSFRAAPFLEKLGWSGFLDADAAIACQGRYSVWGSSALRQDTFQQEGESGWHIDRRRLEARIAESLVGCVERICGEARQLSRAPDRIVIDLADGAAIEAGYVIDCSGSMATKNSLEVAKRGVTVNTISPGYIGTKMVMAIDKKVLDEKIIPQIPMGRLGKPEEVAGLVAYLASEEAAFLTGANIAINGGQHMQ